MEFCGVLQKMQAVADKPVSYSLIVGDHKIPISDRLQQTIKLNYTGKIFCIHCNRKTNKSFSQGYCYVCFTTLARCDSCIVKPEKCHYHLGTCREPKWGEEHCMQDHIIYLANTSGIKIGITRVKNVPSRWLDQGAVQALPIIKVKSRYDSGQLEILFAKFVADKTNWRKMLSRVEPTIDLLEAKKQLLQDCQNLLAISNIEYELLPEKHYTFQYPVLEYPVKVKSYNLDKNPMIEDVLLGIKGQYLIFQHGVINIRKYGGYEVKVNL